VSSREVVVPASSMAARSASGVLGAKRVMMISSKSQAIVGNDAIEY
jgi:hypothetical protein